MQDMSNNFIRKACFLIFILCDIVLFGLAIKLTVVVSTEIKSATDYNTAYEIEDVYIMFKGVTGGYNYKITSKDFSRIQAGGYETLSTDDEKAVISIMEKYGYDSSDIGSKEDWKPIDPDWLKEQIQKE